MSTLSLSKPPIFPADSHEPSDSSALQLDESSFSIYGRTRHTSVSSHESSTIRPQISYKNIIPQQHTPDVTDDHNLFSHEEIGETSNKETDDVLNNGHSITHEHSNKSFSELPLNDLSAKQDDDTSNTKLLTKQQNDIPDKDNESSLVVSDHSSPHHSEITHDASEHFLPPIQAITHVPSDSTVDKQDLSTEHAHQDTFRSLLYSLHSDEATKCRHIQELFTVSLHKHVLQSYITDLLNFI